MTQNIGSLAVSLSLDASSFNGGISQVNRNLSAMASELKASKALGTDYGNSLDGLRGKKDILSRSVEAASVKLKMEREAYDKLVESGKANEIQLERQAKKVNDAQAQYNRLSTELGAVDQALRTQSSAWYQHGEKLEATGNKLKAIGTGMEDVGKSLTTKVSLPLAGLGAAAFKSAVDFEDAFAGVRKTVDMSEREFAILSQGIRDMAKEMPASATEIARVAEAAGQLGIQNDAILGFTRTMTDMGVATNMGSDEAATALARLANITQMNQQDFDRLGSSIVALGNNFATTESEIVDMALRLAGAGAQIGMTEADILGLATALSSVGIEAEMGGSAISRVMVRMQVAATTGLGKVQELAKKTGMSLRDMQLMASNDGKGFKELAQSLGMTQAEMKNIINAGVDLENFSKISGMTAKEFKKAFEEGAVGALGAFINGLGSAEEAGSSAITMLEEMGITEIRLRDSLLRAGNAKELFANAIKIGNNAWEENNALTKEAEERYKTTASQLKILWNRIKDVGISFGEIMIPMAKDAIDAISPMIDKFGELDKEQQKNILSMGALLIAAGPVLTMGGKLTNTLGNTLLIAGNLSKGVAGAGGLGASLAGLASPVGIAVGAIGAVGLAGYGLYKVLNQTAIPEIDIFGDTVSKNTKEAVGAFMELNDEAAVQLNQLKWSGMAVSEEMAKNMIGTFDQMANTILSEMKADHESRVETLKAQISEITSMTEEEQQKILDSVVAGHTEREKRVESLQRQYNGIIERATSERREFHAEEQAAIAKIQREIKETGIEYLSETEREQKVILERIKSESGKINAEQAIETAKRARESKEAVIEEAEKKYDETIKMLTMLRDETKVITQEQYNMYVENAEKARDETIAAANGQYDEVIRIAKDKGGEYVTETELLLGRAMTHWEKYSADAAMATSKLSVKVIRTTKDMSIESATWLAKLKTDGITSATELYKGFTKSIDRLPDIVRSVLKTAAKKAAESITEFRKAGEDIAQGLINGMKSKAVEVTAEAGKLGLNMIKGLDKAIGRNSPAKEFIKAAQDAGEGTVVGLKNSHGKVSSAASDMGKAAVSAFDKTMQQIVSQASSAAAGTKKSVDKIKKSFTEAFAAVQHEYKVGNFTATEYVRALDIVGDRYAKFADARRKIAEATVKVEKAAAKEREEIEKKVFDKQKALIESRKQANEFSLTQELAAWERVHDRYKEGSQERIEAEKNIQRVRQEIYDQLLKANDDFLKKTQEINKNVEDEEKRLNDVYEKAVVERTNSIRTFAGLFDEVVFKAEKTGDDLISNLRGQVSYIDQWSYSIEQLAKRGIDKGLLEELRSMGPKAMPELMALNSLTDSKLREYESLWKKKTEQARAIAVKEMAGLKTDTEKQISELHKRAEVQLEGVRQEFEKKVKSIRSGTEQEFNTMSSTLPQIGRHAMEGLLSGLSSMRGPLMREARSIAEEIDTTMRKALQVKSPSRKTWSTGVHLGEGLLGGMRSMFGEIKRAAAEMASMALPNLPNVYAGSVTRDRATTGVSAVRTSPVINQHVVINSPQPTSPSDNARHLRRTAQELGLAYTLR